VVSSYCKITKVTVSNNFAISSDGIATALQDSASSLMAANNSYQEAVSLIAAANRVVQDPNSVGAALRTISLRLRGTSTEELEEAGEDTDGAITSKSKLRSKIKGYTGIDILTDSGAYKSTYDILLEISKVWDNLTDMDRAGLLEMIAGKTRSNTAAAILSNTKDLEAAYKSAMEAEGSALAENEKYLDSIQGRIDLFNNSVQTMWNNTLDSDVVKFFVDAGTGAIKLIDNLGVIKTLFTAIGAILIQKHFKGDLFGGLFGGLSVESMTDMKSRLQVLKTEYEKAQAAFDMNHSRDNEKYLNRTKNQYEQYKNHTAPLIEEYDKLEEKILSLKESRQLLSDAFDDATIHRNKDIPLINQEIENIQNRLDIAKQQLNEAKSADWDYYKNLGSKTPAKDKDDRINKKTQEIKKYEEALRNLEDTKGKLESSPEELEGQIGEVDSEIQQLEGNLKNVEEQAKSTGTSGLTAFQKIKAGAITAGKAVWNFGKEMLKSMATAYVISTILELITKLGHGIEWVADQLIETPEEAQEKFEELNAELSSIQSELSSLNSELDSTQDRIDELMSQGSLSFTEQEELDRLRAENDELERKIKLNETLEESKQKSVNAEAINATDKYLSGTSFTSDVSKTEKQETWKENGETFGKVAGGVIGAILIGLGVLGEGVTFGTSTGLIALGVSMFAGGAIGGAAGSTLAGASYDSEQSVAEAMDNMIAKRKELKAIQDEALADKDTEAYNEATEALTTYDSQMAKHISQIQENYNAMDWETATDEQKKTMMEYADWLDKYSISMGADGAKSNAISRIFGEEASDDVKHLKEDIEDAMAAAKKRGIDPTFDFKTEIEGIDGLKQRLYDMGLTITDVKYYFLDLAKAEKEAEDAYTTYDTVKEINSLSSGVKSLKDAFGEIQEEGYVSTETLVELEETFGGLGDSWKNFVDTVATGTGSIKEATESINELLEAYLDQQLDKGPMGAEEKLKTIMLLQQLGVKNAQEYIDAMEKASMVEGIASNIVSDKKKKQELQQTIDNEDTTEKDRQEAQKKLDELNAKTQEDYIKEVEETYKVDLTPEEEQALIDKAIAVEEARQEAEEAAKQQAERDRMLQEKDRADEVAKNSQAIIDDLSDGIFEDMGELGNTKYGVTTVAEGWTYKGVTYSSFEDLKKAAQAEIDYANGIEIPGEVDVEGAEASVEEAQKVLDEEKNKLGLTVDIQLTNPSELVDDIQSVFDTLSDAAKEYAENGGRVSVDTFQELLKLEPKYLAMLYNEHGQITLNKEALLQVAQARLYDMTQKQIDSIITNATNAAKDGEIDKLKELTEVLYGATEAQSAFNTEGLVGLRIALSDKDLNLSVDEQEKYYNSVVDQVNATIGAYEVSAGSIKTLGETLSSSGNGETESALEAIQKKYERQIKNLEGQQTYLENEIERAEALNQGASVDYYKEQITLENTKLDLLAREHKELLKLEMNDEVADALWEVEHALQESTIAAINFGKAMHEAQIEAIGGISEAYDAMDTISDNRKENLELYKENLEINGKYASEGWYKEMIHLTKEDAARQGQEVKDLLGAIEQYRTMENPFEEGTDEYKGFEIDRDKNIVDLQDQAAQAKNDWRTAINKADQLREDMKDNFIEALDSISEAFDSIGTFLQNQLDFIDAYEERLNTLNINVPDSVYEAKISTQEDIIANLNKGLAEDRKLLDEYASKYDTDDKRYVEKLEQVTQKELQLYQEETKVLEFEQQIFDNQIDRFNQVLDRIDNTTQRLQNISDLIADEDVATEDGEWTDEGITRLGMAHQQMAYYKQSSEKIAKQMDEVYKKYKRKEITEKEYYETMKALSDQQWDAINSYEDMKDSIVELNEARIDMIEEGLNKEAEAYQELIDLKKEELDAERDLYDFKKNIEKQTKDIASLERRIASMGGSTDASTIAERTKLEAELRNAKDELDGSYRDHAYDSMNNALDDELEAYTKNSEDYIKYLRESIKDTDLLVEQTYQKVLENTDIVLQTITTKANEYGFYVDEYLTAPWENAQTESLNLELSAISHIDNIYNKVNSVTSTLIANVTQPWKDGKRDLLSFSEEVPKQLDAMLQKAQSNQTAMLDTTKGFVGNMKGQIDLIPTYADSAAKRMLATAKQNVADINAEYAKITYSSYEGGPTGNDGNDGNGDNGGNTNRAATAATMALQKFLNNYWNTYVLQETGKSQLAVDGKYGPDTTKVVKAVQKVVGARSTNGLYDIETGNAINAYYSKKIREMSKYPSSVEEYKKRQKAIPYAIYAKGTLGTTRDQLAISDESWIGEEITLAAGKNGQLQYLKKGSAVLPSEIATNLVEWGKLNPKMMGVSSVADGINLMSNYINKPELKLDIENFLKVDRVDRDTLPELEKLMDQKIDAFAKQLNYSLKKFK
jgi:chromosome segregation ATPase